MKAMGSGRRETAAPRRSHADEEEGRRRGDYSRCCSLFSEGALLVVASFGCGEEDSDGACVHIRARTHARADAGRRLRCSSGSLTGGVWGLWGRGVSGVDGCGRWVRTWEAARRWIDPGD